MESALKHLLHFDFVSYHLIKLLPECEDSAEASYLLQGVIYDNLHGHCLKCLSRNQIPGILSRLTESDP